MPIITIFKGASTGGEELAKSVAEALGYRCVSREVLVEASQRYAVPEAKMNEILEKEPSWWKRWLENLRPYRIALQSAMCEVAQKGNIVYHGHMGHELLPGIRHVLKVLLTTPVEFRVEQVQSRHKLNEAGALHYIEEVDNARTRRLMALFGADWKDPGRYDLVLNISRMGLEGARNLIVEAARFEEYQPTPASEQDFQNLTLATRVQAALMMDPRYKNLAIDVRAEQGQVNVSGVLARAVSEHEIIQLVEGVPGVSKVVTNLIIPDMADTYGH